ncbi:MAG TPA: PP2C family protein-serine/threonine phosphatase [Thermoanaerobaculia bacterium]
MLGQQIVVFCRTRFRSALISIPLGAVFATIFSLGSSHGSELAIVAVVGAVIGFWMWVTITILLALFTPTIHRMRESYHQLGYGVLFMVAGVLGYFGGALLARLIFGRMINISGMFRVRALPYIAITAGLVVVVGLAFRTYEALRDRLSESIEQLKATEWATKELELARLIQTRLLPPQQIEGDGFSIAARNFPAHLVAGDFYDVVALDDGSVAVIVADVAGKGMGASLIMASVKAVLPFVARGSVEEAMAALNAKLVQELGRREFVALAFARFFPSTGVLQLANAGFPDPYLLRGNSIQLLTVSGIRLPLGVRDKVSYQTLTCTLQPKDRLLFVSDGIPEAPVGDDQPLGYERLADAMRIGTASGADAWLEELLTRIRREVREPLADDWTALVLQFTEGARAAA